MYVSSLLLNEHQVKNRYRKMSMKDEFKDVYVVVSQLTMVAEYRCRHMM
jgi:hypothetical protein